MQRGVSCNMHRTPDATIHTQLHPQCTDTLSTQPANYYSTSVREQAGYKAGLR